MTHTYVLLDVSRATFDEIHRKLDEAGYQHSFDYNRASRTIVIDMHGIGLRCIEPTAAQPAPPPAENG